MLKKSYDIISVHGDDFAKDCAEIIRTTDTSSVILRMVFFGDPENDDEYIRHLDIIGKELSSRFNDRKPVFSYIAQKPFGCSLAAEVTYTNAGNRNKLKYGDNYILSEEGGGREIITGGIMAGDIKSGIFTQSQQVFSRIGGILSSYGFRRENIYRQWNYIAGITHMDGLRQHYQDFNDARSGFYAPADWSNGYPAATGIGTSYGGITVELDAVLPAPGKITDRPLDNKLQVSAHLYSQQVLKGDKHEGFDHKTTPKFERARLVGTEGNYTVYVSGTAAIRGEESLMGVGVEEQTRITMENIGYLISEECTGMAGYKPETLLLRIYIKHPGDFETIRRYMEEHYPGPKKTYLHADVCRDELLVEIEGVVALVK